jgi:uncharacterized membrane protein
MDAWRLVALVTAAASGLMGGVLFAFSTFVMPALRRLSPHGAVTTMQAINMTAPRALAVPLVVSGVGSVAVAIWAVAGSSRGAGVAVVVAGAVAGAGAFLVTVGYHVPRNDRLARVDPGSRAVDSAWAAYHPGWVAMNHVRTALSLASAGLVLAGVGQIA